MPEFLSPAWIDALDTAARAAPLSEDAGGMSITIEQVVRDAPDGETRYHLRFEGGRARVRRGPAQEPDLRLYSDYDVAVRLHQGEINAQDALTTGGLKVQGPLEALLRASNVIQALQDLFAPVRAVTTFPEPRSSR